jgi:hypothetical protein
MPRDRLRRLRLGAACERPSARFFWHHKIFFFFFLARAFAKRAAAGRQGP